MRSGYRAGDGFAETIAPGGDQLGVGGKLLVELGRRLGIGPPAIELLVPGVEIGVFDETQTRLIVGDLTD
jgi:hypothetical protein